MEIFLACETRHLIFDQLQLLCAAYYIVDLKNKREM
jgi:hypothetical protein